MPHYKDATDKLHFIEDARYEHLLPAGSVEITDAEAEAIRLTQIPIQATATEPTKAELLAQIAELAAKVEAL